jgi:hypothetical protein
VDITMTILCHVPYRLSRRLTHPVGLAYCDRMRHLTFADKSLLVGDEVADLLMEYATLVVSGGHADTVRAFGADGQEVVATLLLDQGVPLMAETSQSSMVEPDNAEALEYLRGRIRLMTSPLLVELVDDSMVPQADDLDIPHTVDL